MSQNHPTRSPVVAIMGHVDHGKSTLLDTIRHTNTVASEAGGITQHVSAYEVIHTQEDGTNRTITFIDTPGHAAFSGIRERSASIADIAILIVAADDGVKAQTLEALHTIQSNNIPFLVAINKIDKPGADTERVKRELMEHNIFLEGYGGDVSYVEISAKTGVGIPDLLETILLLTDILDFSYTPDALASGFVIESHIDPRRGIGATLLIKNGTIKKNQSVCTGNSCTSIRSIENFAGKPIDSASASAPVRIYGFSNQCVAGLPFTTYQTKSEAEEKATNFVDTMRFLDTAPDDEELSIVPVVVKCDVAGSIDAVISEIHKHNSNRIYFKVINAGVGAISENDIRLAAANPGGIIAGFNVSSDQRALDMNEAKQITIKTFSIIYKLSEWFEELAEDRKFRKKIESVIGSGQLLKVFSSDKNEHLIGVRVASGVLQKKSKIRIVRNREIVSYGIILSIQMAKSSVEKAEEGAECGMMVQLPKPPQAFDIIESYTITES